MTMGYFPVIVINLAWQDCEFLKITCSVYCKGLMLHGHTPSPPRQDHSGQHRLHAVFKCGGCFKGSGTVNQACRRQLGANKNPAKQAGLCVNQASGIS